MVKNSKKTPNALSCGSLLANENRSFPMDRGCGLPSCQAVSLYMFGGNLCNKHENRLLSSAVCVKKTPEYEKFLSLASAPCRREP